MQDKDFKEKIQKALDDSFESHLRKMSDLYFSGTTEEEKADRLKAFWVGCLVLRSYYDYAKKNVESA